MTAKLMSPPNDVESNYFPIVHFLSHPVFTHSIICRLVLCNGMFDDIYTLKIFLSNPKARVRNTDEDKNRKKQIYYMKKVFQLLLALLLLSTAHVWAIPAGSGTVRDPYRI